MITPLSAYSQPTQALRMDRTYRGIPVLPDFKGRDKAFATYRTRISDEIKTGPNFAGHYAIVTIGCGTSCRFAFVADVATGKVYDFPYGGEEHYGMDLRFEVKHTSVTVRWVSGDNCMGDYLTWTGTSFQSSGPQRLGARQLCELG